MQTRLVLALTGTLIGVLAAVVLLNVALLALVVTGGSRAQLGPRPATA